MGIENKQLCHVCEVVSLKKREGPFFSMILARMTQKKTTFCGKSDSCT